MDHPRERWLLGRPVKPGDDDPERGNLLKPEPAPSFLTGSPAGNAPGLVQLSPDQQVVLIESANGWVLIAREGEKLGYVEENSLARLQ